MQVIINLYFTAKQAVIRITVKFIRCYIYESREYQVAISCIVHVSKNYVIFGV